MQLAILNINFAYTPNGILVVAFKNITLKIAVIKLQFRRNVYLPFQSQMLLQWQNEHIWDYGISPKNFF